MASDLAKRLERPALAALRGVGRLAVAAPPAPRATGGYGRAFRGGLLTLFLLGLLVSWPARGAGLTIMLVASLALFQFLALQYRGALLKPATVVWLAAAGAVLAIVIGVIWSRWEGRAGTRGDVVVLAAVIAGLAILPTVRYLFGQIFGPHHPESSLPDPEDPTGLWFWTGAVTHDRATVVVRLAPYVDAEADEVVIEYGDGRRVRRSVPIPNDEHRLARVPLPDLEPDTSYELRVLACGRGEVVASDVGTVTTFPPLGRPADVTLAFGSCLSTGSRGQVFDTIRQLDPLPNLFVVTGDLHYENLTSERAEDFLAAYDQVHASQPQRRLYGSLPFAYVWDDHDFGDNDSDHGSRSKWAAQRAYRRAVPHYLGPGEPEETGPIHQELTIGRVRVLLTDNRSERGEEHGHLLLPTTEQWLIDRIVDPAWPLVVWVSPTPWISKDSTSDNWGAYDGQRRRIAEAIAHRSGQLVMVSGDAHMVAIDDGTNSAYAGPDSGFPVLHAAALDRLGSVKGGPFSHGRFPGAGQFGLVSVTDRGHEIDVALSGRNWTGAEIVGHTFTVVVDHRS